MGFRFRKSKNFGPFRVNLSSKGIGWSVGGKGFRYTHSATGKNYTTTSIPGTGISYRTRASDSVQPAEAPPEAVPTDSGTARSTLLSVLAGLLIGGAILFGMYLWRTLPGYTPDNRIPPPPDRTAAVETEAAP